MVHSILIVDDNPNIRRMLRSLVELKPEYRVCGEAENGEIAIDKVRELKPDVVILDLQMPLMDGLAAARHINSLSPETTMLMLTMHANEQLRRAAFAAGITAVLSKTEHVEQQLHGALLQVCH